jgi:hypothetical protein
MPLMRRLFGPSREEVWKGLCDATKARYVEGGFWKGDKVQADHGEWTVTLDTYTVSTGKSHVTFTRMRAPYVNPSGFRFTVHRKGFLTGLAKLLGMQDIEIGHEPFDTDFVVKANDESRIRRLLASPRLRELIAAQPAIELTVRDDEGWFRPRFPEGVDELHFQVLGVVKDVARLQALFDLFAETLDELCRQRLAEARDPGMEL